MEIITWTLDENECLFCESTQEIIYKIDDDEFGDDFGALKGWWLFGYIKTPTINDKTLAGKWESYFLKKLNDKKTEFGRSEGLKKFLEDYKSIDWIVYEITTISPPTGPGIGTSWFVVSADTDIRPYEPISTEEL